MTAKVTVKVDPGTFLSSGTLTSLYTDSWAETEGELLESYRRWHPSVEIVSFEIVEGE